MVNRVQLSAKDQKIKDDLLILSCEEDHAICVPFLDQGIGMPSYSLFPFNNMIVILLQHCCYTFSVGAEAYSSELLLNGIVIQKLEFERYEPAKSLLYFIFTIIQKV